MDSTAIGNLIATFAAVVAIGSLAYQSRSTRKQIKLQNFIEYTKRYQEIILHFPERINRSDFVLTELSAEEYERTMRYMRAYMDLCFEEHLLHEKGFIDDDLWSIWEGGMKTAFSKKAFQDAWAAIKQDTEYGEKFTAFADKFGLNR
ncbi:hypothetical protein [Aromatoleum aromaticum]|uniref:Uncharacterized protein n=1 Tax=Aromatoleum aromaticum (strain DSM 19018 / LMG 30748 / EbN1) TaxID=76114 RepID=Q5NZE7_AROAE|nr:hypothetical protein [Aromatoleum aromaticum]NMG55346.1 hypothetical protein [Aromatoleum aromaticum]CAI09567.1 conserved hypothetical protein [Aromatoleum aromaticum EbN1]